MYSQRLLAGGPRDRILRIRSKLARLRRLGWERFQGIPGVAEHRFEPGPPPTPDALEAFENYHEVELPPLYRVFLLEVGEGGPGPFGGLLPLASWDALAMEEPEPSLLAGACSLHPGMVGDEEWDVQLPPPPEDPYRGLLPLAGLGEGYEAGLVLTGPYRGRVVYIDGDMQPPLFTDSPDFLAWYERWVDDVLAGNDTTWFGFHPTGDEAELRGLLGAPDPRSRAGAASGIGRLARVEAVTVAALQEACADRESEVRSAALYALAGVAAGEALPCLVDALSDPEAEVRRTAVLTLRDLPQEEAGRALRPALWDPNGKVVRAAIFALLDRGIVAEGDLMPLLGDPREEVRATAGHALGERGVQVEVEALVGKLDDPAEAVRLSVVQALRKRGDRRVLDALRARLEVETSQLVLTCIERTLSELA